ncbi:mechanosensitive ion channel family protein [Neolewinella antarctica]|uniref:Small-conductance mechanosensitive channel n=1 Tax=Neolewinella antarctica TaxID=442734 RepID=A0ABX0XAH3_9BACT|nr:mechanosensitive ion channel family protein [Neolewinella antarctica]NJC25948.1 small-conductance mechanosensitive channel [Neolewinella antarctica]
MRYVLFVLEIILIGVYFLYGSRLLKWLKGYPDGLALLAEFMIFLAFVDALRRLIGLWYAPKFWRDRGIKGNFEYGIDNIAKVVMTFGGLVYAFRFFGVDPQTLLTSMSIVAAAIAIITKEYINDFLVGLYFSFSRNFEINDYVKMGEYKGKITELQILKIRLLNDNDDSVLIPNGKVYNSEIINYTRRDTRAMSVDFEVNINNVDSIEQLESDLAAALTEFDEYIEPESFNLRVVAMHKDSLELKFQYRLQRFDRELQRDIKRKTVRVVFSHLAGKRVGGG